MKKRIVRLSRQELANVVQICRQYGEFHQSEDCIRILSRLPKPNRNGDDNLDIQYIENVLGERTIHGWLTESNLYSIWHLDIEGVACFLGELSTRNELVYALVLGRAEKPVEDRVVQSLVETYKQVLDRKRTARNMMLTGRR